MDNAWIRLSFNRASASVSTASSFLDTNAYALGSRDWCFSYLVALRIAHNNVATVPTERHAHKSSHLYLLPPGTGFVRMTLSSHRCDVIMGYPQGNEMVQNTNPYYQTAYAFVSKTGGPLERWIRLPTRG